MLELFIIRHGEAGAHATSDEARELTHRGQQEVIKNAQAHLANRHFDYVFVSPYKRAQQTWQLIQAQGVTSTHINDADWVTPDVPTQPALDHLIELKGDNLSVLVVSHQTFSGRLVTHLCDGHTKGKHLDTATIAHLKTEVFASQCATLTGLYSV